MSRSTMSLATLSDRAFFAEAISDMTVIPIDCGTSRLRCEQIFKGLSELMWRVRLAKAVRAVNKQSHYFVGNVIARRVEHAQSRPNLDCPVCKFAPTKNRRFEIDIGKSASMTCGERRSKSASSAPLAEKCGVTPILNRHLREFADERIVFDDKYHGGGRAGSGLTWRRDTRSRRTP
jgi:hypothetical protein